MATQQHEGAYQKPSVVSLPVKLSGRCVPDGGRGRISKDGTFLWLYDDTQLEVYAVATGQKISSWAHKSVKISCACELPMKSGPSFLVMGMRVDESVNVVAAFSPALSQVVRAVQVEHAVSILLAVSSTNLESNGLFSQCVLTGFTGIVAVGCHGGGVLLLDLALHSEHMKASRSRGVNEPIGSHAISPKEGLAVQLEGGLHSHLHTCVDLTVDYRFTSVFKYVSSSKKLLKQFSGAEVVVTALHYVPQINSLLVGFNFGSFQIYNLTDLSLDHSNPYSKISAPVVDFIYQEPENDPKNLVFVWVAQGPSEFACSLSPMKYSNIALYQLLYEDKLKCGGPGGHVFSNFKGCIGRFDHFLSAEPTSSDSLASVDSRLVRCATLERLHQGCDDASEGILSSHARDSQWGSYLVTLLASSTS